MRTQARRRGLDRKRRRLVDLHHGEDEMLYRMDGLEADEMQDVIKARVVAHIVEPRACPSRPNTYSDQGTPRGEARR